MEVAIGDVNWKPFAWHLSRVLCFNYKLEDFFLEIPGTAQLAWTSVEVGGRSYCK